MILPTLSIALSLGKSVTNMINAEIMNATEGELIAPDNVPEMTLD